MSAVLCCCDTIFLFCSVSDKILHEEVGQKELINVEGIISYRLHTNVKYDSEKKYIPGYGVPGKLCKGEVHMK